MLPGRLQELGGARFVARVPGAAAAEAGKDGGPAAWEAGAAAWEAGKAAGEEPSEVAGGPSGVAAAAHLGQEGRAMATAPPRVKLITIDGLFRQYNHVIPLRLDERVTVLHGRNGVGKTVTLRLVAALLRGEYEALTKVPFERLRVDFTDGSFLCVGIDRAAVGKKVTARRKRKEALSTAQDPEAGQLKIEYRVADGPVMLAPPELLLKELSWHVIHFSFFDSEKSEVIPRPEREPAPLRDFRSALSVHFVEAQRLFRIVSKKDSAQTSRQEITTAMADIALEMAARIQAADSTYRSTSTRLDDSLPARLFAPPKNGPKVPKRELNERSEALEAERRRLHEIGLLADTTTFNPSTLTDSQRAMFIVYLKDNEEKLAVFKDLADRAEILLSTLNRKLAPKSIKLDKDVGYKVLSHDGRPLDLDVLSSGEQHELVLLHTLLFRVEPGAFLLIDEPELSLHVTWQNEFLAELIQIAKKVGFDALVATHSPYIVGERRDLMVRLGEPV
jgi:predicted ATPase